MSHSDGWIGVDLDGTLAEYTHWKGVDHVGKPIPRMIRSVKEWLRQGFTVKIFTARVAEGPKAAGPIKKWCKKHIGVELEVTNVKDFKMIVLWDDRAVQVEKNTGRVLSQPLSFLESNMVPRVGRPRKAKK